MPEIISEAGLEDEFEACFDQSLGLYSLLQQNGYMAEAQYATLLGHKLRFRLTHNALEAFALQNQSASPHPMFGDIIGLMQEKLTEVHPIIGGAVASTELPQGPLKNT